MKSTDTNIPPVIPKEQWLNSPLPLARHYGGITINGKDYLIIDSQADLIMKSWIPVYKRLGRDRVFELIKNNVTLKEARKIKQ